MLENVRTKTFKITVTPAQYEDALKSEVWPYRVAVRHFRASRRTDSTWSGQSSRAGGLVDRGGQAGGDQHHVGRGHYQGGARSRPAFTQQQLPDPFQLQNLFGVLGQLGSRESPLTNWGGGVNPNNDA